MISIMFTVYGHPVAKGRPRFSTRGKFPVAYTPEKTKTYESEVGMMAKAAMGASQALEGALEAFIYVTFPVPASYSKKRTWSKQYAMAWTKLSFYRIRKLHQFTPQRFTGKWQRLKLW